MLTRRELQTMLRRLGYTWWRLPRNRHAACSHVNRQTRVTFWRVWSGKEWRW